MEKELTAEQQAFLGKWSWGGFWLHWVWAIASRMGGWAILYLFLICIPIINIVIIFVLGISGRKTAWDDGKNWKSFAEFQERQRTLDTVALALFGLFIIFGLIALVMSFA